eukprot:6490447-Amphidinium_carterae.1
MAVWREHHRTGPTAWRALPARDRWDSHPVRLAKRCHCQRHPAAADWGLRRAVIPWSRGIAAPLLRRAVDWW